MTVSPAAKSSKVQFDGALVGSHQTGRVAFASTAAVDNAGLFIAPCDLVLKRCVIRMLASSASANAEVAVGDATASGAYHSAVSLQNKAVGTQIDLDMSVASTAWAKVKMSKGDMLKFKGKSIGGATTAAFAATLVYVPLAMEA